MTAKQIITYGTNYSQEAFYSPTSRGAYDCANAQIARGITGIPNTLDECFNRFGNVKEIAELLGFITGSCGPINTACGSGSTTYGYTLWTGATTQGLSGATFIDMYLNNTAKECSSVVGWLGTGWLGCLWGTPDAPFSCTCPSIGPQFEAYLKHRLNVATFWNTPKNMPVKRAEFLDALKYGQKSDVTVAGDFNLKIGQVVYIRVDGASGYPYQQAESPLNGYYYIIGVKHVVTLNTHETALSLTKIPENKAPVADGGTFAADYI
jgi:hypothetical protein